MTRDRHALIRLARAQGVGPVTYRRALETFGDPHEALERLPELVRGRARDLLVPDGEAILREEEALAKLGGRFVVLDEPDYPALLAEIDDAPPVLSLLGDARLLSAPSVAVVGARNASGNGRRFAETLAAELALAGIVVVSGLARGIDAAAHLGAAGQGRTVAVVAGGLDRPYPPEHARLQADIAAGGGAVLAEQALGTEPLARHFPRRNRIVAGMTLGCVVVEAAPRSGSLITARLALDAGRELFAVPGSPLDPRARGANDLLRRGEAHLCEGVADVLAHLPQLGVAPSAVPARAETVAKPEKAGDVRDAVLELLGPAPTAIDDLVRRCQFSASSVAAALVELELAGRVETLPGSRVCLVAERGPAARE